MKQPHRGNEIEAGTGCCGLGGREFRLIRAPFDPPPLALKSRGDHGGGRADLEGDGKIAQNRLQALVELFGDVLEEKGLGATLLRARQSEAGLDGIEKLWNLVGHARAAPFAPIRWYGSGP